MQVISLLQKPTSSVKPVIVSPIHDIEAIPFLYSALVNDHSIEALLGLRAVFQRGSVMQSGLIPSVVDIYKSTNNFSYETLSLAVIVSYLLQGNQCFVNDLQLLAELPNGKMHQSDSIFMTNGRPYTIQNYLNEIIASEFPELEQLVSRYDDSVFFSTAAIRAHTLVRLKQMISENDVDSDDALFLLETTSGDPFGATRANSVACTYEVVESSDFLNAGMVNLLKSGANDKDPLVKRNALEALQMIVKKYLVLMNELEPIFISSVASESEPEIIAHGLRGIINILDRRVITGAGSHEKFIKYTQDTYPNEVRALALIAIAKQLEQRPVCNPRLQQVFVSCALDKDSRVKAAALFAISVGIKHGLLKDVANILISNLGDPDPDVRAHAFGGISYVLERENIAYPEVFDFARKDRTSEYPLLQVNALNVLGKILEREPSSALEQHDLDVLLHIASTGSYETAKAATYVLSVIVNNDISNCSSPEQLDKIEVLCQIFAECIPDRNEYYWTSIRNALQRLEKRNQDWEEQLVGENDSLRRLVRRKDLYKEALKQMSSTCSQCYQQLLAFKQKVEALEGHGYHLESRLAEERMARARLEQDLQLLLATDQQEPQEMVINELSTKVVLLTVIGWIAERTFKEHGFDRGRISNDLKAKFKARVFVKKPLQHLFGLTSSAASEIADSSNLFSTE